MNAKIYLMIICILAFVSYSLALSTESSWNEIRFPFSVECNETLYSIYGFDRNEAIVAGSGGTVGLVNSENSSFEIKHYGHELFYDVNFDQKTTGFLVGSGGVIYKTIDRGNTWTKMNSITYQDLYSVSLSDSENIWVAGENHTILHSTDGGYNWSDLSGKISFDSLPDENNCDFKTIVVKDTSFALLSVYSDTDKKYSVFASDKNGLKWKRVVADSMPYTINDSLIKISIENDFIKYYWKNDGEIWFFRCETPLSLTGKLKYVKKLVNRKSLITNQNIYDQCTVNAGTQWVAGEQCSVYKTVDDGKTWISQNSNNYQPLDNLSSVYFIDKCHGYITGQNGTLLTTENGGNSWSFAIKPINASNNFKQVVFSDRQNGYILFTPEESYIGNSNRILRTSDSGRSWNICSYNNSDGDTNGVTIKGKMKLLCFLNRNWMNDSLYSALPNLIQFDEKFNGQIRSNNLYWVHDLYSFSTDTFWCVGYAEIFKTYDGGKTIEKILSVDHYYEVNYCFNSITFTSPSTGWVVGSGGLILKSTDSGQTWQQQTSPTNGEIKKIRFVNPAFGWMFNNKLSDGKGNIFITSDSGKTWKDYSVAGFQLNDVFCPDTENCWAVGNDGLIMRLCNTENRKISIVYPKKKNEFKAGDTLTVKWTSPGVSKVSIAISYDNGASYTTYRAVTEDDGDETIQISANPVLSDKCILRIRSADGTVQGTSETFSITANDVAVNDLNLPAIQKENIKVVNSVLYYTLSRNVLAHAALYSISGREIFRKKLSTESCGRKMEKLPLDKLEKGCYLMRITAGENVFSDKIIIHR